MTRLEDDDLTAARAGAGKAVGADEAVRRATPRRRAQLELLIVATAALLVSLSQSLLIPILSILPRELGTSPTTVEWLLTSTLMAGVVAVPVFGRLGDMYGKRLMLVVSVALLVAGSLLMALTDDIPLLILGRVFMGMSLAAVPLGISLVGSLLPRGQVASGIALVSAMLGVGGALGLPFAGLVGERESFHTLFWLCVALGVPTLVGILLVVPESLVRSGGRIDAVGAALLAVGLVCLLLPLTKAAAWGWTAPRTIVLLLSAVIVIGVFLWWEMRTAMPLVDLRVARRRPSLLTNIASLMFGFALFASLIGTAPYVQAPRVTGYGFGASIVVGGLCALPGGLSMLFLAPVAARLINLVGARTTLQVGALVMVAGFVVRLVLTGSIVDVIAGTTLVGMGTGIGYASMPALVNAFTPAQELASANGLNSLARSLGNTVSSAVAASLFASFSVVVAGASLPSDTAYRLIFICCGAAALLAASFAAFIPRGAGRSA